MIPAEELERTHFHDASLARCFSNGDALHLHFNNIAYEMWKEEYYSAHVVLHGVREIRKFGTVIAELKLESESSDVLQFHRGQGMALLLIEWGYYRPHANIFVKYEIDYDTSEVTAEMQDGLIV